MFSSDSSAKILGAISQLKNDNEISDNERSKLKSLLLSKHFLMQQLLENS